MSDSIRVEQVGGPSLERVEKILADIPGGLQRAIYQALKRAGETGKTRAGQFAAAQYTISKGTFMRHTNQKTTVHGSGSSIQMSLGFSGSVIPIISFETRGGRHGTLVTTRVMRGSSPTTLQHAFRANVYGDGIWERVGRPRFPVQQFYGPSGPHMVSNDAVVAEMEKVISETYESRMEQEILRLMNGW